MFGMYITDSMDFSIVHLKLCWWWWWRFDTLLFEYIKFESLSIYFGFIFANE